MSRDNTDVVAKVKSELEARGVNLSGPCGAFEITRRVAWALRDDGAGLLAKPAGNSCNGFSVDVVVYGDGTWVDCLVNAETENKPAWQVGADKLDPQRWVAPTNPEPSTESDAPPPAPAAAVDDEIQSLIDHAGMVVDALVDMTEAIESLERRIVSLQQQGVRIRL